MKRIYISLNPVGYYAREEMRIFLIRDYLNVENMLECQQEGFKSFVCIIFIFYGRQQFAHELIVAIK